MNKKQKAAAIALSAVMACGMFAGCDLVTTDSKKDLAQTVASVNISGSEYFQEEFEGLENTVETAEISKLEMIMSYMSNGGDNLLSSFGNDAQKAFDALANSLVQRQIYLQYAKAYFLKNGSTDDEGNKTEYRQSEYLEAVKDKTGVERDLAGLGYFLTEEEEKIAEYNLRVSFNSNLDSLEQDIIEENEDIEYESSVRTTPTGANTANSDYYLETYTIYTGTGSQAIAGAGYEKVNGSTTAYRKSAYFDFIAALRFNNLIEKGEDTSDIESLNYYKMQKRNNYASMLIQKLGDEFTKEAEKTLTETYLVNSFNAAKANQLANYTADISALESALDGASDTSFILTAPENNYKFGFVVNILLPFSTAQSDALSAADQDFGDNKGNKFSTRAALLKNISATDQRGSWFTGETDYSFDAKDVAQKYTGGKDGRQWLFFEDNFAEGTKYEQLKNYYGQYTYNGTYDAEKRIYKPNSVTIDTFLTEMTGYMDFVLGDGSFTMTTASGYYDNTASDWYQNGKVDYSKFVYAEGKVDFGKTFDANQMFVAGTPENKAYSVIRELSFAYNTDTAGLNSYLGYGITANKTDFVSEFEYAAQKAVEGGAGTCIVVPSDYGWHVIYCTFSFANDGERVVVSENSPYAFDYAKIKEEGTFSNLYYESIKANTASTESSNRQTKLLANYDDSYEIFKDRYKNLTNSD